MKKEKIMSISIPLIAIGLIILAFNLISTIMGNRPFVSFFLLKLFLLYTLMGLLIGISFFWRKLNFKIDIKYHIPKLLIVLILFLIGASPILGISFINRFILRLQTNFGLSFNIFQILFGFSIITLFTKSEIEKKG